MINRTLRAYVRYAALALFLCCFSETHAQEKTYDKPSLGHEMSIDEAQYWWGQILDLDMLLNSKAAKAISNDARLVAFVEGFMERNDIGVLTISYLDSEELWPKLFKGNALKKIEKAPDATLVAGILFFPEESIDGETRNFTARLVLEGKTNEVYDLLNISGEDMALISEDTSDELIGDQPFSKPKEAQDKVVNAMIAALQKVEQIADPTSPTGQVVTFRKKGNQKHGFDLQTYEQLQSDYPTIVVGGESYPTAWKSLKATQPDEVIAIDTSGQEVAFELDGIPVNGALTDGKYTLSLQGSSDGTEGELLAKVGETMVGKLNTVSYSLSSIDLKIVPVNGAGSDISQAALQRELDSIYASAVASWNVQVIDNQELGNAWDTDGNGLDDGETGSFTNYTDEMNDLIKEFKRQSDRDKDAYYIFLVDRAENASKLGYMPRKKQWGFVFTNGQSTEALTKTIAHELGHGVYRLEHPFSEKGLPKGQTDNLMDYSSGKELYKYQWDYVHDPASVVTLFDDDQEGAYYDPTYSDIWAANLLNMMCAKSREENAAAINVDYSVSTSEVTYGNRGGVRFEIDDIQIDIEVGELPSKGSYTVDISSKQTSTSDGKTLFSYSLSGTDKKLSFSVDESSSSTLSSWLTSPPASLFQTLVDNVSSSEGNAAYSTLTRLPECAYELITAANRVQYIDWMVSGEWVTNEHQEELIIRLLEEVPDNQVASLVTELESYEDWEGLFESFDNVSTHQGLFRAIMKLYQSSTTEEEQKNIQAVFDFNMLNHTSSLLDYISVAEVSYQSNQLNFTREISTASWTPTAGLQNIQRSSTPHAEVGLFEPVLVIVNDDHTNLGLQPGTELKSIPAILAAFFIEKKNSETNKQLVSTGLDIALFAAGVGEVSAAIKAYQAARNIRALFRLTLAISDLAVSYADLACQSDDSQLCNEWREVSFYIQIGLLSVNAADGLESLIRRSDQLVEGAVKVSKSNLFNVSWTNNIQGYSSPIDALKFWNNISKDFKHLTVGEYYLKFDDQAGSLLFGNHTTGEIFGFYEGLKNVEIIESSSLAGVLNKLKIYHGAGSPSYVNLNVSSGARIIANPNKTATIVGNYKRFPWNQGDMKELIPELLGDLKTQQFGPKKGGFNVLNVADEVVSDWGKFWNDFNKPWLEAAINRGDDIWAASDPMELNLLFKNLEDVPVSDIKTPQDLADYLKNLSNEVVLKEITGFGNELRLLSQNGYVYNQSTKMFVK